MDKKYYESGGDGYSLGDLAEQDSRITNLVHAIKFLGPGKQILDIGCGDLYLAKCCPESQFSGIDIHPKHPNATKHDLTVFPYPFKDAQFDAVVCSEVLEHLFDPMAVLEEAHRLLKKKGVLFITVPNYNNIDNMFSWHGSMIYDPKLVHTVEHIRNYTTESMSHLLKTARFSVVSCVGNSPQMVMFFARARKVIKNDNPTWTYMRVDQLIGRMFPEWCAGFLMVAEKV